MPSMGAGLLHSLLLKVKYHFLQQFVQPRIRVTPMYTTRKKVPDFSLVKSHTWGHVETIEKAISEFQKISPSKRG